MVQPTGVSWSDIWNDRQNEIYIATMRSIDPDRAGIEITCPKCASLSWVRLPKTSMGYAMPLQLACPRACGECDAIEAFNPVQIDEGATKRFDTVHICRNDGSETRTYGRFIRCAFCAYENSRELMMELTHHVERTLCKPCDRDTLADLLSRIVSTFDGVMRACWETIVSRVPLGSAPIPPVSSFQNLNAARVKMLGQWDVQSVALDWDKFILAFQKRHCFAHTLGIADQAYIDKSGDLSVLPGQGVSLDAAEVLQCAREAENIVKRFYAGFFS